MVEVVQMPSLHAIRAFEAAARLGSFAQAGRELGTTAASVSYHIRQLETHVGVSFFTRQSHKVELTEAGALVAADASHAFALLKASFAGAAGIDEARLCITTLPTLGTSWLTPRLGKFRSLHPSVAVELDLSQEPRDLAAGGFDVAIRNGHGRWPGLKSIRLFPSLFTPLCVPHLAPDVLAIANCARRSPTALLGRPDWWALWLKTLGVTEKPMPQDFGSSFSAEHLDIAAAIAGHGIAIGSPILFAGEIASGRLVAPHQTIATDGRSFWLTYPATRRSRKVKSFQQWIEAEVEEERRHWNEVVVLAAAQASADAD